MKPIKGSAVLTAVLAALSFSAVSHAEESMRCGSSIVTSDATPEELVQKCGEPASKKVTEDDIRAANAGGGTRKIGTTSTEVWTYDRGTRAFAMEVTIVDGKIRSIVSKP